VTPPRGPPSGALGLTTTVPAEIIYAAGRVPADLNNLFIRDPDPAGLVREAELRGFPAGTCAWIKGMYGAARRHGIRSVVGVVEGDCAETRALVDVWAHEGMEIIPFRMPADRSRRRWDRALDGFAEALGVTRAAAEAAKGRLDGVRSLALRLDRLAAGGSVPSGALFDGLLDTGDFAGDPARCADRLEALLAAVPAGPPAPRLRLSCAGVPTVLSGLWEALEERGARVVDHEVPRQFALLGGIGLPLADAWAGYTNPCRTEVRWADVGARMAERGARGLIHYVQSFCHRHITDRLWRDWSPWPVLTVEADRPGPVDARTLTRIEAFLERLLPP